MEIKDKTVLVLIQYLKSVERYHSCRQKLWNSIPRCFRNGSWYLFSTVPVHHLKPTSWGGISEEFYNDPTKISNDLSPTINHSSNCLVNKHPAICNALFLSSITWHSNTATGIYTDGVVKKIKNTKAKMKRRQGKRKISHYYVFHARVSIWHVLFLTWGTCCVFVLLGRVKGGWMLTSEGLFI